MRGERKPKQRGTDRRGEKTKREEEREKGRERGAWRVARESYRWSIDGRVERGLADETVGAGGRFRRGALGRDSARSDPEFIRVDRGEMREERRPTLRGGLEEGR
jgi:hypothetical protein